MDALDEFVESLRNDEEKENYERRTQFYTSFYKKQVKNCIFIGNIRESRNNASIFNFPTVQSYVTVI